MTNAIIQRVSFYNSFNDKCDHFCLPVATSLREILCHQSSPCRELLSVHGKCCHLGAHPFLKRKNLYKGYKMYFDCTMFIKASKRVFLNQNSRISKQFHTVLRSWRYIILACVEAQHRLETDVVAREVLQRRHETPRVFVCSKTRGDGRSSTSSRRQRLVAAAI